LLRSVEEISKQIGVYDQEIEKIGKRYPEKKLLTQVWGVGTLIALTFILTIEDPERFEHSRDVGPYLGLTRKRRDSGESQPELGISKAGDELMRRLLVQGAQCILRQGAPDSDLKAWGMARLPNGGKKDGRKGSKATKKKTVVAIARKLAVRLHRLWVTGEVYDPQYNRKAAQGAQAGKVAA
jgi:transposase